VIGIPWISSLDKPEKYLAHLSVCSKTPSEGEPFSPKRETPISTYIRGQGSVAADLWGGKSQLGALGLVTIPMLASLLPFLFYLPISTVSPESEGLEGLKMACNQKQMAV
jgi:hypothetical protein